MTPAKRTLTAGSLLAPCGSLRGSAVEFAAAQALVLRPAHFGGAWEPSSADLAFLREHGRHLRYLELPAAALQPLRRLRLLHVDGLSLPGLELVRLASTLAWLVLANVGELPSLHFLGAARPRLVSLRGRRTCVADGKLSSLLARRPAYVGVDRWHDDYDVAKERLPKGDPRMPESRHRDPTGFAASS